MAVVSLQAESATANPCEFERIYRAWRYAKAQWDLADNDPANPEGLTMEEEEAYCDAEHAAQMAFYLYPVSDPKHIARKLRYFRDEHAWQYARAPEIIDRLFKDVHQLAFGHEGD